MTDNTPLNAHDELKDELYDIAFLTGADSETGERTLAFIDSELVEFILADRKKHELRARIDELENRLRVQFIPSHWERLRSETNSWAKYVDRRIAELKLEAEL